MDELVNGWLRRIGWTVAILLMLVGFMAVVFLLAGYDLAPASRICRLDE
jgi:hypothetical protein